MHPMAAAPAATGGINGAATEARSASVRKLQALMREDQGSRSLHPTAPELAAVKTMLIQAALALSVRTTPRTGANIFLELCPARPMHFFIGDDDDDFLDDGEQLKQSRGDSLAFAPGGDVVDHGFGINETECEQLKFAPDMIKG